MNIGVIGLGTVGYGVIEILNNEKKRLENAINQEINIKYGCSLDVVELPKGTIYTSDYNVVLNDESVDVIVELIGGTTIAREIVLKALQSKKHVVTANKALLAKYGQEIFTQASKSGVHIFYEASVGGGIPVMVSQKESLIANNTTEILGILNGTTNFILTLMENDHLEFEEALKIATDLGYVEANPSLDLDGHDAANKICLLAMNGFETYVDIDQIKTTGITSITKDDIEFTKELGYRIKLIGQAKKVAGGLGIEVFPTIIPYSDLISHVNDAYNVVEIDSDYLDNVIYYGKGAGRYVTASAVVSDIIKTKQKTLWHYEGYQSDTKIFPIQVAAYYVRSNQVINLPYHTYINKGEQHIYIFDEIDRDILLEQLKGASYTICKARLHK